MADTVTSTTLNTTNMTNLFKYLYDKRTYITYNAATPLWARVKKEYGAFTMGGKSKVIEAVLGFTARKSTRASSWTARRCSRPRVKVQPSKLSQKGR
jgi:hypothetical protein